MKKKLLSFLLHPVIIALVISSILTFFIPNKLGKYQLVLDEKSHIKENVRILFPDLDNDGVSEKMWHFFKGEKASSFILYDSNENIIDQWTFDKKYLNGFHKNFWFKDINQNGFNEIFFFTQQRDSIFLNCIEPINEKGKNTEHQEYYIDSIGWDSNQKRFGSTAYGGFFEKNSFIFSIVSGFGGYPRNTYNFNYKTEEIIRSDHLTNVSILKNINSIVSTKRKVLTYLSHAYDNKLDSIHTKRSDKILWVNILDENLDYYFTPVELKVPFSSLFTIPFNRTGESYILAHLLSRSLEVSPSKLLIYSLEGKLIQEKELDEGEHQLFKLEKGFYVFNQNTGVLKQINFELELKNEIELQANSELHSIDIDEDGIDEWFTSSLDRSSFTIYEPNFKNEQTFDFSNIIEEKFHFGVKNDLKGNQLYFQNGSYYYLFNYGETSFYILKLGAYYLSIFMIVLVLVFLIGKGQKYRLDRKRAIEKEITELQLKTIKNQVDPHFVFNAMNTISGMMLTDKKEEADAFICDFSELMRSTLQQSDKIFCSLQEELKYVEAYIKLQKVRFNDKLSYSIKFDNQVDLTQKVPKHIIYTYVENAIKHGLKIENTLQLNIILVESKKHLRIEVEDNGGGFSKETNNKTSTGNGLKIMEKIFKLYAKLYKKEISHSLEEVNHSSGKITGLRVLVNITI